MSEHTHENQPCEVCGGSECPSEWHVEVMSCPVCQAEYDEFTPQFGKIVHELFRRAGDRRDKTAAACRLAAWLENQAPYAATKSRDFGRGFMHAAKVLRGFRP